MPIALGSQLGPYRILAPLGAGGMGEVYRARDEQLLREVAVKVLPQSTARDGEAVARFEREARAVAALSHPNIVAVHSFGSEGDARYLVMELLEGETLAARLRESPLPWRSAVETAAHVAEALAAAHGRGVIHRDMKPSNVFLTKGGAVKVLDFGLARTDERGVSEDSPTEMKTGTGVTLGTPGYMSPEQVAGDPVDSRTDIFSLGCILHEMLTGQGPFRRPTAAASLAATLRDEPAPLPGSDLPPELSRVVARCLQKSREDRYQSARDVALDLHALSEGALPATTRVPRRPPVRVALWAGVVTLIVAAVVAALGYRARPGASPRTAISSLAVLPFENASRQAESEFLVDGITEGLINALARLPDMRVVARTTAFAYKGKPLDLDRVRRDLAVDAVLTGRVTERDGGLAVQADLIDLRTGAQLWGSRYRTSDPIAIEQAIVADIGERLRGALTRDQQARLGAAPTGSSEAYRLYLRGRYEWNKRRRQELQTARDYFQQAIERDPAFALAYVGLADTYILMGGAFRVLPQPEALARADAAARRALEIDPGLAAAHASLGLIQANQFRWKSAERELRAALDLDPNYATARGWYSIVLKTVGRRDEALEQVKKAQALDPLSPLLVSNLASLLNLAGDYEGAIAAGRKALDLDPRFAYGFWTIGTAYESQGRYATAADFYRRMEGLSGPPNMARALLGRMQAKLGQTAEARRVARELELVWPSGEVAPTHIAWVWSGLRANDRAFSWLERALAARDIALRDSLESIHLAELRDDPRFADLRHRMLSVEE